MPSRADDSDVEISAAVKAKKLRLARVTHTDVKYTGASRSSSERKNLPQEVDPGVTYRDIEIWWRGQARLSGRVLDAEAAERNGRHS